MINFREDVARAVPVAENASPLAWVGMRGIDFPLQVKVDGKIQTVHSKTDVAVNLPAKDVRGIHMSRLYRILERASGDLVFPSDNIKEILADFIRSHEECGTDAASLSMNFHILKKQMALASEGIGGWTSYPIQFRARQVRNRFSLQLGIKVIYSSTCPCSASLARELIAEDFGKSFDGVSSISTDDVKSWLFKNATNATPHSQRSRAHFTLSWADGVRGLSLEELIDTAEAALSTPVQAAVKRQDEQMFARLNGQNLMYVEDAARRLQSGLKNTFKFKTLKVDVTHMESLHPHDAFAISSSYSKRSYE